VAEQLGLASIFDATIRNFDEMLSSHRRAEVPEFFIRLAPVAKGIKKWFASKVETFESNDAVMRGTDEVVEVVDNEEGNEEFDLDFLGQFLELDESFWLQSVMRTEDSSA
jgi:hypothetical protein